MTFSLNVHIMEVTFPEAFKKTLRWLMADRPTGWAVDPVAKVQLLVTAVCGTSSALPTLEQTPQCLSGLCVHATHSDNCAR